MDPVTPTTADSQSPVANPGPLTGASTAGSDAYRNTILAMALLKTIPANHDAMSKLPAKAVLVPASNDTVTTVDDTTVPLVADAWGNPIIFVPGNGLQGVKVGVRGDGSYPSETSNLTIRSPDNRPFFASAGPDGDMSRGDDNLYSFQQ